jgi:hypothetical protein
LFIPLSSRIKSVNDKVCDTHEAFAISNRNINKYRRSLNFNFMTCWRSLIHRRTNFVWWKCLISPVCVCMVQCCVNHFMFVGIITIDTFALRTILGQVIDCAHLCAKYLYCTTFSYNRATNECRFVVAMNVNSNATALMVESRCFILLLIFLFRLIASSTRTKLCHEEYISSKFRKLLSFRSVVVSR